MVEKSKKMKKLVERNIIMCYNQKWLKIREE
jgi:hypothetical protein